MNDYSGTGTSTGGIGKNERSKTENELMESMFHKGRFKYIYAMWHIYI